MTTVSCLSTMIVIAAIGRLAGNHDRSSNDNDSNSSLINANINISINSITTTYYYCHCYKRAIGR